MDSVVHYRRFLGTLDVCMRFLKGRNQQIFQRWPWFDGDLHWRFQSWRSSVADGWRACTICWIEYRRLPGVKRMTTSITWGPNALDHFLCVKSYSYRNANFGVANVKWRFHMLEREKRRNLSCVLVGLFEDTMRWDACFTPHTWPWMRLATVSMLILSSEQ